MTKKGVETKNYEGVSIYDLIFKHLLSVHPYYQIAEASKIKPLEVDLKRLEDLSDSIVRDFALMRKREEEMRDTNGMHFRLNMWINVANISF